MLSSSSVYHRIPRYMHIMLRMFPEAIALLTCQEQ